MNLDQPVRRLVPDVADTTIGEQVGGLHLISRAHEDRPYVITNFAVTLDGHATIAGRSGAIGSDTDTAMLVGLRTRVDAVMIGAGTMRAERYGRVVGDPAKREQRERDGLSPDPLMVIVSGRLELPWDAPLFTEGHGLVLIATASADDPPEVATSLQVYRQPGELDLATLLRVLRQEHGVRSLLCEGGPRLHGQLIEDGLIDELFVTHAPKLAGGVGPGLVSELPEAEHPLELGWLLADDDSGELFGRYLVPSGG